MSLRKIVGALVFSLLISGCSTGYTAKIEQIVYEGPFHVERVIDGDTIVLENSKKVRLSGVNTPETGECGYLDAKSKLEYYIYGEEKDESDVVYLERDRTNMDKYGRLLRYVYNKDKILVNKLLVEGGYADAYDKYKDDTKRFAELDAAEQRARAKNLGIWSCVDVKEGCLYVYSVNSDKYHKPDCKWAKRISPDNLGCIETEEELEKLNLEPCGTCKP